MAKISTSNTKAEIMAAYKALQKQMLEEQSENIRLKNEIKKKSQVVQKADEYANEDVSTSIASFKKKINESLDEMVEKIETERSKFLEISEAIKVQNQELKELYEIEKEAETLNALIETHRRAKEQFKNEMETDEEKLEEKISMKKTLWKREEEEYKYNLKLDRKKEQDKYAQEKEERERAFAEKEKLFAERAEEWKRLKKLEENYENTISGKIKEAEKQVTSELKREFDYEQKLASKETDIQLKLYEQEISLLKARVEEQSKTIERLKQDAASASSQAKEIALKAIENTGLRSLKVNTEKGLERDM